MLYFVVSQLSPFAFAAANRTPNSFFRLPVTLLIKRGLTSLNFGGIRIDSTGVKALAGSLLANHPTLELLDLSHCMTGPKSRRIIAEAMQANTRLKKLVTTIPEIALESSDSE